MVDQQDFGFDPAQHRQPPPVVNFPGAQQPPKPSVPPPQPRQLFTEPVQQVTPQYLATARAVSVILATRFLLLISVVTSSLIWGYAVWEPDPVRTVAATAFSVVTLWPLTWLYWKKG